MSGSIGTTGARVHTSVCAWWSTTLRVMSATVGTIASQILTAIVCGLGGLAVGWLVNVVVDRASPQLAGARPRSTCPSCAMPTGALRMLPVVSWVAVRGHCRHCAAPISARYPVVELLTGVAFAGAAVALGSVRPLASVLAVCACALAAAVIDAEGGSVPRGIGAVAGLGALSLSLVTATDGALTRLGWAALGAALTLVSAGIVDRATPKGRWTRHVVVGALGWSAGWLWPGGGPFVAAWVVVAAAASGVGSRRRPPLAVLLAGAVVVLLAAAVINQP